MNKSILVVDTPKICGDCWLFVNYDSKHQHCNYLWEDVRYRDKPLSNCPLKELPQKRELPKLYEDNYELKAEIKGWNACIDEILGEENE